MSTDPTSHAKATILVMTAGGANPAIVINALSARWPDVHVIQEHPESKLEIWRRRARRLGPLQATGQLATMIASRLLKKAANKRMAEICHQYGAQPVLNPAIPVHHVGSINDGKALDLVRTISPSVVVLVSTRLMKRATLAAMPCPVINLHAGINPAYRGQMGGYWSLVENDRANFGATVHLVDAGIDTGETLHEVRPQPAKQDFISTYPMLLTAASVEIVCQSVEETLEGRLAPRSPSGPSHLRFPPAIWTWVWHGLTKGIW
ncbi:formyl transferase [Rhizobium sp. RU36D]|uniref:formyl transferase n=1 Tax=Rhizobium sp. RU36D TaxID=1907415 RepID=UPI0009D7EADB|nr:formyl transferase [Rhizobium sp. RU36D]SMD14443.1 Formyl transferase [Rhizobium sp. RU36D]